MWRFLSRGRGETEGFSNGSLAEFKGNPLQALAREVCQNSLDAADGSGKPVIVEFDNSFIPISSFPGMDSMRNVIDACKKFWKGKGDVNTITFINNATECLKNPSGKFNVLRVSDYNTTGVKGAFSDEDITPWGSLVKGNAFSVKTDEKNAAGSYGIGKAAPFVSSYFQTVFYRTLDVEGKRAALGVARLMAHESIMDVPEYEDPVRRSVGYYGETSDGKPASGFAELNKLNVRTACGTDLFIPGFTGLTRGENWTIDILKEIVDNFLYSIYSGKLEVRIDRKVLNRNTLEDMLDFIGSKDAKIFYQVIKSKNPDVLEFNRPFYGLGTLRLRLLYAPDLNKKVLVVRNSGMRIAKISSLPRMISYTGFLELQGPNLNQFFRSMENPSHNAWEPKRHGNPEKAKLFKEEVETWVIEQITKEILELSGDESDVSTEDCFNSNVDEDIGDKANLKEGVLDITEQVETETYIPEAHTTGKISIRDEGKSSEKRKAPAREDPEGKDKGHRRRTGTRPGGTPSGRKVTPDLNGSDTIDIGEGGAAHEVMVSARIISHGNGNNKLIFVPDEEINLGRIEIVTKGENGKSLILFVKEVQSEIATVENGRIVINNVPAKTKQTVEFTLADKNDYAMGVKAYGN